MRAEEPASELHRVCLSIGSNIEPEQNIPRAVDLLRQKTQVIALSSCWQTKAIGSSGPDFINMAVHLLTGLSQATLKEEVISPIETALGRVRTPDKNAPRTIDLDIIVYEGQVIDASLWKRVYLALPISEFYPDLPHPENGQPLHRVALALQQSDKPIPRPEYHF